MGHLTESAMREIAEVLRKYRHDRERFYKVNWIIVQTSHQITDRSGHRGHITRQQIRRQMWLEAQRRYPPLRIYNISGDISGDMPCRIRKISWLKGFIHKIKISVARLFRKIRRLFR